MPLDSIEPDVDWDDTLEADAGGGMSFSRECNNCQKDRVVSKHEFRTVFSPSSMAKAQGYKIRDRLGHLFPQRGDERRSPGDMLDAFLSKTPEGHPEYICSYCYTPQYWGPGDTPTGAPERERHRDHVDPADVDDLSGFM